MRRSLKELKAANLAKWGPKDENGKTRIDREYDAFIERGGHRSIFDSLNQQDMSSDYQSIYGSGESDPEWNALQAEYQERFDAENAEPNENRAQVSTQGFVIAEHTHNARYH